MSTGCNDCTTYFLYDIFMYSTTPVNIKSRPMLTDIHNIHQFSIYKLTKHHLLQFHTFGKKTPFRRLRLKNLVLFRFSFSSRIRLGTQLITQFFFVSEWKCLEFKGIHDAFTRFAIYQRPNKTSEGVKYLQKIVDNWNVGYEYFYQFQNIIEFFHSFRIVQLKSR